MTQSDSCDFVFPPVFLESSENEEFAKGPNYCVYVASHEFSSAAQKWTEYEVICVRMNTGVYENGGPWIVGISYRSPRYRALPKAIEIYRQVATRPADAPELSGLLA